MFCTWMGQLELQWNLRTKDTLGLIVLSIVERLSLSRRVPYRRFHCLRYSIVDFNSSTRESCVKYVCTWRSPLERWSTMALRVLNQALR